MAICFIYSFSLQHELIKHAFIAVEICQPFLWMKRKQNTTLPLTPPANSSANSSEPPLLPSAPLRQHDCRITLSCPVGHPSLSWVWKTLEGTGHALLITGHILSFSPMSQQLFDLLFQGESKLYVACWFNTICYGLNVFWPPLPCHTRILKP